MAPWKCWRVQVLVAVKGRGFVDYVVANIWTALALGQVRKQLLELLNAVLISWSFWFREKIAKLIEIWRILVHSSTTLIQIEKKSIKRIAFDLTSFQNHVSPTNPTGTLRSHRSCHYHPLPFPRGRVRNRKQEKKKNTPKYHQPMPAREHNLYAFGAKHSATQCLPVFPSPTEPRAHNFSLYLVGRALHVLVLCWCH